MDNNTMRMVVSQSTAASILAASTSVLGSFEQSTNTSRVGECLAENGVVTINDQSHYFASGISSSEDVGIFIISELSRNLESAMMEITEGLLNSAIQFDSEHEKLLYENLSSLY